jgi:hypothetical protein
LVIAGSGWGIRVRGTRRRTVKLKARAHLFRDPLRLCLLDDEEISAPDTGGQALASFFVGDDPVPEDRSTVALAWAYAYSSRADERQDIDLAAPDSPQDAPGPPAGAFAEFTRQDRRKRISRGAKQKEQPAEPPPRKLVDLDEVRLGAVSGTFLEAKRRGTLKAARNAKLSSPKKTGGEEGSSAGGPRSARRQYTDREREDAGYAIVEAVLRSSRRLELDDIRDQPSTGADAVDRKRDIWIELKAHGQDAPDSIRLEPAEAERAEEKRGSYWLIVIWNLEKPRTPEFVVIPDPLHPLDTYLGRGLKLTGVRELAEQSRQNP